MADTFNKKLFEFDFSTMTGGIFKLGDFSKYQLVALSLKWTGVDTGDSVVTFEQCTNNTFAWNEPMGLNYTLTAGAGSEELLHSIFVDKYVGVKVAKGTASTGILEVYVRANSLENIGVNQYNTTVISGTGVIEPYTATAGQTVFPTVATLTNNVSFRIKGIGQNRSTYTATAGTNQVVTTVVLMGGEEIEIEIL